MKHFRLNHYSFFTKMRCPILLALLWCIFSPITSTASVICRNTTIDAKVVSISQKPNISVVSQNSLTQICGMSSSVLSNSNFSLFLTTLQNTFEVSEINRFFSDFAPRREDLLEMLNNAGWVSTWKNNPADFNRTNLNWIKWVNGGRRTIPELTNAVSTHIYSGEIKIDFKDGTSSFLATPRMAWTDLKAKFMSDEVFATALLKTDNIAGQSFNGLHSIDEIEALKLQMVEGNSLVNYVTKIPINNSVDGKNAYTVNDPRVWIPDVDKIKAVNKGKAITARIWNTKITGRSIRKKKIVSSCFVEGMSATQIEMMISEAFMVRIMNGYEWDGTIYRSGKRITVHGFMQGTFITSAFISQID